MISPSEIHDSFNDNGEEHDLAIPKQSSDSSPEQIADDVYACLSDLNIKPTEVHHIIIGNNTAPDQTITRLVRGHDINAPEHLMKI